MTVAPSLVPRLFLAPVFDRCLQYWIDFECCKSSKLEAKIAGNEASGMNFWCNIASSPGPSPPSSFDHLQFLHNARNKAPRERAYSLVSQAFLHRPGNKSKITARARWEA